MKGSPQGSVREEPGKSEPGISGGKGDVKKEAEMAPREQWGRTRELFRAGRGGDRE